MCYQMNWARLSEALRRVVLLYCETHDLLRLTQCCRRLGALLVPGSAWDRRTWGPRLLAAPSADASDEEGQAEDAAGPRVSYWRLWHALRMHGAADCDISQLPLPRLLEREWRVVYASVLRTVGWNVPARLRTGQVPVAERRVARGHGAALLRIPWMPSGVLPRVQDDYMDHETLLPPPSYLVGEPAERIRIGVKRSLSLSLLVSRTSDSRDLVLRALLEPDDPWRKWLQVRVLAHTSLPHNFLIFLF